MDTMKKPISILMFLSFMIILPASVSIASTDIINIYDANGNLVTGDGKYYEYNDANQLVKVHQGDQNGTVIAEYFYDFAGRRVKKIENGVTTYYIGPHFEKQVGGANAGDSKYYFAGGDRVAKKDSSGNLYYYHLDHLGGTNAVTDQSGTVVASINYYPFGETKPGSSVHEKYSYTGQEKDNTPGLYYFKARYNHPEFRHFTQPDTIIPDLSNPQSLNRYSYVENNPVSFVDPDGHKSKKRGGLSKREDKCKKMGLNPDKCKKKLKKKKKKRGGLSKREAWMIAHGRDPDKDKTPLKVAKKIYKKSNQDLKSKVNYDVKQMQSTNVRQEVKGAYYVKGSAFVGEKYEYDVVEGFIEELDPTPIGKYKKAAEDMNDEINKCSPFEIDTEQNKIGVSNKAWECMAKGGNEWGKSYMKETFSFKSLAKKALKWLLIGF